MSDAPKSAFELAMERLKKKDAESGVEQKALTDAQKAQIAEVRKAHEAHVAERRIMHDSTMLTTFDPSERDAREDELRRDLDRFQREADEKVKRIREN